MNTKRLLLAAIFALTLGCAGFLTGAANTEDALKLMKAENARGCIYVRASATPWAQATMILLGTWGKSPPAYTDCWQGLPSGVP